MKRRLFCGVALGLLAATPVLAQTAAGPEQPSAVQEVIVTAQKRQERVADVPISITVVNSQVLQANSANNLIQLQGVVPGITFQGDKSYGGSSVAIRGVTGNSTPLQDDPVAVYVDGVYSSTNNFTGASASDLASIEIVRGPQGTLQGRNATAGALIIRTQDPKPTFGGEARALLADPLEYRAAAAVNVPITSALLSRFSVDYYYERGWLKNITTGNWLGGQTAANVRGVLLWKPTDKFRARLMVNYQRDNQRQALARWAVSAINPTGQAVTHPTPDVPLSQAQQDTILEDHQVAQQFDSRSTTRSPFAALELTYDMGAVSLVSISGYNSNDVKGVTDSGDIGLADRYGYNVGDILYNNYSQEVRLQSNGGHRFNWLMGGYASQGISDFKFDIYNLRLSAPTDRVSKFQAHQKNPTTAAFADGTYNFTDQLSATAGIRYTQEKKQFRQSFSSVAAPSGTILAGPLPFNPPEASFSDTSYRFKGVYRPIQHTMIYVSYSRGFKSGGFNAFSVGPSPVYNPETLRSAEVGVKTEFWDRRGYVAGSYYDNSYDNLQVSTGVPTGGVVITNAATAKIKGFELEGHLRPTDHLTLDANVAYIDGVYSRFLNAPDINGRLVDASGKRLRASPEWQYFAQARYDFVVTPAWTGTAQVNYRWRDKIYLNATNQNVSNLIGRALGELGARLSFHNDAAGVTVALYGANLTDDRGVTNEGLAFNYPSAAFNKPRSAGLEVQKAF